MIANGRNEGLELGNLARGMKWALIAFITALAFASIEPLFPGGLPAWWTYL